MPFRMSDQRRVQDAFDAALPPPYEALVSMSEDRTRLAVRVPDPDNDDLTVAAVTWDYDSSPARIGVLQPPAAELTEIAAAHATICGEYVGGA